LVDSYIRPLPRLRYYTVEILEMKLEDLDPMPYGKYKGVPMQDVPARYLHWLWTNGLKDDPRSDVGDYIRRSVDALKQDYPDGIWD
jgi:uncharacterized protein (DUF3820 family)